MPHITSAFRKNIIFDICKYNMTESKNIVSTSFLSEMSDNFATVIKSITLLKSQLSELQTNIKVIEKSSKRYVKQLEKELSKRNMRGNKKPSGFAKPTKVSSILCSFMNKPSGTELARTEVTQYLIEYIKDHNLQNESDKRKICPDQKLKELNTLKSGKRLKKGNHILFWDGKNNLGQKISNGVYFVRITIGTYSEMKKLIISD